VRENGSIMDKPIFNGVAQTPTLPGLGQAAWSESLLHLSFALLTFVTGLVDAVGYLALGRVFTANMTGNVVLLGFAAARVPGLSVVRSIAALLFACVGGILAGRLEGFYRPKSRREWLTVVGSVETFLLVAAALVALRFSPLQPLPATAELALIGLTAVSMGVRNGTVRHLGIPDITTTVLTLTVAALSSESSLGGGANPYWGRRVTAIVSMLLGAFVGAVLLRFSLASALGVAAAFAAVAAGIHHVCVSDVVEGAHAS
jgi:uncharacterized membrane protein YoaK (UPF0700 family)